MSFGNEEAIQRSLAALLQDFSLTWCNASRVVLGLDQTKADLLVVTSSISE